MRDLRDVPGIVTPDVVLELEDGRVVVDGPDDAVDGVASALAADRDALQLVVDVFGSGVGIVAVDVPATWPPRGGFVPAWRRLSARKPLIILPSETVSGRVDPYATEAPTLPCPSCGLTAWHRAGSGWSCRTCHPPVPPDARSRCEICGAVGRPCGPDHVAKLRQLGERMLKQTRSAKKRAAIQAALDALPVVEVPAPTASRRAEVLRGWRAPRTTTTRQGREITWSRKDAGA
jgi:hypothetical protein